MIVQTTNIYALLLYMKQLNSTQLLLKCDNEYNGIAF